MIKLKKFISFFLSIVVAIVIILNSDKIAEKIKTISNLQPEVIIKPGNDYAKSDDFLLVQQTKDYIPYNYDDLLDIFYSLLNQGWNEFTFYCPVEYENCLDDVAKISYNEVLLSDINNYVHPYNSYSSIKTLYDDTGEVTVKVTHLYSDDEIKKIDADINRIIKDYVTDAMSLEEKIKVLHDYIIDNTKYDTNRANDVHSDYDSARILGVLYDNYAICSGYTDIMAVILDKLGVKNFKVASETHIWNVLYYNGEWVHLDLTWDDPVSASGKDILDHSYFLIDDITLEKLDSKIKEHIYDKNVYLELKD